jgi:hypothetical protein
VENSWECGVLLHKLRRNRCPSTVLLFATLHLWIEINNAGKLVRLQVFSAIIFLRFDDVFFRDYGKRTAPDAILLVVVS